MLYLAPYFSSAAPGLPVKPPSACDPKPRNDLAPLAGPSPDSMNCPASVLHRDGCCTGAVGRGWPALLRGLALRRLDRPDPLAGLGPRPGPQVASTLYFEDARYHPTHGPRLRLPACWLASSSA